MRDLDIREMQKGKILEMRGKHYAWCHRCKSIVRLDKPLFGDLHFCRQE